MPRQILPVLFDGGFRELRFLENVGLVFDGHFLESNMLFRPCWAVLHSAQDIVETVAAAGVVGAGAKLIQDASTVRFVF